VITLSWIGAEDPRMLEVHTLRHEVLFAPFGLPRDDRWDDEVEGRFHLVAEADGVVVGYAQLLEEPDGSGHVRQVSVRADLQGSGVGRGLMAEVAAEAARRGLAPLWLHARVTAEPFYRRLGYVTTSGVFPSGRTQVPHVRMELDDS
jgi:predicted GNAT family N-acyltransferase